MSTKRTTDTVCPRAGRGGWKLAGGVFGAVLLTVLIGGRSWAEVVHAGKWSYHGQGTAPEFWGTLNHGEWSIADTGREQSPINVEKSKVVADGSLTPLVFHYQDSDTATEHPEIINNGHTIQVNLPVGNTLEYGGKTWSLKQFHFHVPSENTLNGQHASMEGHLVHKDVDGNLLVVGVFYVASGSNTLINWIFHAAPEASHDAHAGVLPKFAVNPADLLPEDRRYYTFPGSLTTPPCSEGVTWILLPHAALADTGDVLHMWETFEGSTNRPVQALNSRTVRSGG